MIYATIAELADALRARRVSPVELVEALLQRIERHDVRFNSFLLVTRDIAVRQAKRAKEDFEKGSCKGPLHGIPYGLKDIVDVAGLPTTAQSKILRDNIARSSSAVAERLDAAGAVLLGKLTTHEFAMGGPSFDLPWPPARNPWNRDYFAGGSSSGSAVAVAAGFLPWALGTDTRGSIRNPASMCGIVGMKPTYGRVSRRGIIPLSYSLDHVGPLTRTVGDNALVLSTIAGADAKDATSVDSTEDYTEQLELGVQGVRIGLIRRYYDRDIIASDAMGASIDHAVRVLERLGARIVEIDPGPIQEYNAATRVILIAEAYAVHEKWLKQRPNDYGRLMLERVLAGAFINASDYIHAQRQRSILTRRMNASLAEVDVAITASNMEAACKIDDHKACERVYEAHARAPCNLTGNPALSVPSGFSGDGLPLGFQVIGKPFAEAMIYRVARAYERATEWQLRRPFD